MKWKLCSFRLAIIARSGRMPASSAESLKVMELLDAIRERLGLRRQF